MIKEHHFVSPKLEGRQIGAKGGHGLFAIAEIAADELLLMWGGDIWTAENYHELTEQQQSYSLMVEENLFLVSTRESEGDWINHSCDPNAWLVGQIGIYARRAIAIGEEVTFDYATCDSRPNSRFDCGCQSPLCRKIFRGNDWMLPELQARYAGHFMPYLERRIQNLKTTR